MSHRRAADVVLIVHGLFIVWVVAGAFAVLWRAWLAALHVPAVAWAVWPRRQAEARRAPP